MYPPYLFYQFRYNYPASNVTEDKLALADRARLDCLLWAGCKTDISVYLAQFEVSVRRCGNANDGTEKDELDRSCAIKHVRSITERPILSEMETFDDDNVMCAWNFEEEEPNERDYDDYYDITTSFYRRTVRLKHLRMQSHSS